MQLFCDDNINIMSQFVDKIDCVYADMIYENDNFTWVVEAVKTLKKNGVLIIQTDYHSVAELKVFLDSLGKVKTDIKLTFVNWLIYKQEWGGTSKKSFPHKHDDILIYSRGSEWKFYPERIQIPKKTAGTAFDVKGTGLKTPCSVFDNFASDVQDDLGNFSTMSKERVKGPDGKNIRWQKPLKLMERLLLPFTDVGDTVLDPFMGSGTTGLWCKQNNRNFIGIELDKAIFELASKRLK